MFELIAQAGPDVDAITESGISEVSTEEWILAAAVFVAAIVIATVARRLLDRIAMRLGSPAVARLAGRAAAFVIVSVGFFYALASVDVSVGPLLGALGIAGIALAFALQEILSNLLSGVLLQTRRPFKIGDQIVTGGSGEHEGRVEDINFRVVKLTTFDGETVYVPNSMVLQNPIVNWTRTPMRRTSLAIGVAYDADLDEAAEVIVSSLEGVEGIASDPAPEAYVEEFGDSSVNFSVRFWHPSPIGEMWQARDGAARAIKRALDDAGITIPFPQTTLWFGPGGRELPIRSGDGS